MKVVRYQAYQGHPVPAVAYRPRGPFPPDLLAQPARMQDETPQSDDGGTDLPFGATAQNGYVAPRYFQCNYCGVIVGENDLDTHECEDDDGPTA